MKIPTKIAKLPLHENLYKNVNENMFSFTLKTQLISSMISNPFKWQLCSLRLSNFPNLDGQNTFLPNLTGPLPKLQRGRKIPVLHSLTFPEVFQYPPT